MTKKEELELLSRIDKMESLMIKQQDALQSVTDLLGRALTLNRKAFKSLKEEKKKGAV